VNSPPFHPDQLVPDSQVGPWRVVASLGSGGFGRVFKVERGGKFYALKMALRPAGPHSAEEEDVNGRLAHEVAAMMACAPHPSLPRVHAVDRWPEPPDGYLYFVTDYIDGETFHEWRWRVKPTAAHLLSVFTEVVRVVADLHRRGMHHRDLKGDNLLIRREDERPFLIDLGTVRMPGATTLTVGVAPASPHLLPPECVAFLREGSWQEGAHFDAGVPGDLYALGALLYEALTDGYAFDPKLPYDRLLPAIETVVPRAPHVVNPKVPRALGDVAMRLMAKRPEDRYAGTESLLQALWEVAKEKRQPAWRVSLDRPPEVDTPGSETPRVRMVPEVGHAPLEALKPPEPEPEPAPVVVPPAQEPPVAVSGPVATSVSQEAGGETSPVEAPPAKRVDRRAVVGLGVGVLVLGFVAFGLLRLSPSPGGVGASVPPPPSEKGSPAVTSRSQGSPDASTMAAAVPPSPDAGLLASAPVPPDGGVVARPPSKGPASSRALKAAAAACVGLACASGPKVRTELPDVTCPPEVIDQMKKWGITLGKHIGNANALRLRSDLNREQPAPAPQDGAPLVIYSELEFRGTGGTVRNPKIWPKGSRLLGTAYRTKDHVYGWLTELVTPDGERHRICGNLINPWNFDEMGMPFDPSSTPEQPMLDPYAAVVGSKRLGEFR
jgi:serine/threonine protein kinase